MGDIHDMRPVFGGKQGDLVKIRWEQGLLTQRDSGSREIQIKMGAGSN